MNKLLATSQPDRAAELDGVWVEYTTDGSDRFRVKIARAGTNNGPFLKMSNDLTKNIRKAGKELSDIDHEKQREITRKLYATHIVRDWNEEDFGQPFSKENVEAVFKSVNEFLDFVVVEAQKASNYIVAKREADTGN